MFKTYIKYKIINIIQERIIFYEKEKYKAEIQEIKWKNRVFIENKWRDEDHFNKDKKRMILWINDEYKIYFNRLQALNEILELIKKIMIKKPVIQFSIDDDNLKNSLDDEDYQELLNMIDKIHNKYGWNCIWSNFQPEKEELLLKEKSSL